MFKILKLILFLILLIIIFVIWYLNFRKKHMKGKTAGYVWVGEGPNPFEEKKEEKEKKERIISF